MSYRDRIQHIRHQTAKLQEGIPEVMKSFYSLSKSSSTPDAKNKELIALASHCDDHYLS